MGRLVRRGRAFNCVNVLFTLAVGYWLLAFHIVMLNSFQHLSAEKD